MSGAEVATPPLDALLDAFNAHDLDAIMSFFTEDCVFDTSRGPAPGGHRFVGKQQVRKGFQARFDGIPDIEYGQDRHWTCGDRGVSEWTIRGTQAAARDTRLEEGSGTTAGASQGAPMSSCQSSGCSAMKPARSSTHSFESRSTTSTPHCRSQSIPPEKLTDSPTTTLGIPNWRTSPLQYQHGASVVTITVSR
jgi:hypothetical protein